MVSDLTKKLREPIAFGLIAVAILYLVSGVSLLFKDEDDFGGLGFAGRAAVVGHVFTDPLLVVSLAGAVLLATGWREATKNARSILQAVIAIGVICLILAIVCWIAGLTADRINAYGGVNGAGRIVGVFLGLAQIAFLGLVLAYAASVLQAIPRPVRAQQQWAPQQQGWGPQQPGWGQQPPAAPYYDNTQQPAQPGWQQQPQQQWGQPMQGGSPYGQPQQPAQGGWQQPQQQPHWGDTPGQTPPAGSGWTQQPQQPQQPSGWQQPEGQGYGQATDPGGSPWTSAHAAAQPTEQSAWESPAATEAAPSHAAWDQPDDTGSTWSGTAEETQVGTPVPSAAADDDGADDIDAGAHADRTDTGGPDADDATADDAADNEAEPGSEPGPDNGWWRGSSS